MAIRVGIPRFTQLGLDTELKCKNMDLNAASKPS